MGQSLTVYASNPYLRADMEPFFLVLDWQGDSDVAVSLPIATTYTAARRAAGAKAPFPERIHGKIRRVETIPGYLGDMSTYLPYGTYGLTIKTPYSEDLLDGSGAARSASAAESVTFSEAVNVDSDLTFTIATTSSTDELAGAGAFTGAATGWTLASGWAYGTNNVSKNGDGTGTLSHSTFAATAAYYYDVGFTISSWSVGTVTPKLGNTAGTAVSADGAATQTILAANTDGVLFTPSNTARFVIDSVTVKRSYPRGRTIIWFE